MPGCGEQVDFAIEYIPACSICSPCMHLKLHHSFSCLHTFPGQWSSRSVAASVCHDGSDQYVCVVESLGFYMQKASQDSICTFFPRNYAANTGLGVPVAWLVHIENKSLSCAGCAGWYHCGKSSTFTSRGSVIIDREDTGLAIKGPIDRMQLSRDTIRSSRLY